MSLNTLAFDSTYKLIDDTLALGVNLTEVRPHLTSHAVHGAEVGVKSPIPKS